MDKTITLSLQLSLIAPFVTVLVAALVSSRFLKSNPRWPALLGVTLTSLVALIAVLYFNPLLGMQSYSQTLISWLTLSSKPAVSLDFGVLFDSLSLSFYLLLSLVTLSFLVLKPFSRTLPNESNQIQSRYGNVLFLISFFATAGIILSTNFLQLLFCWCLLSMSLNIFYEVQFRLNTTSDTIHRHWWGWNAFADAMLLLVVFLVQTNFKSLEFLQILQPEAISTVTEKNRTALPGIDALLFFAALPRLGLFPASSLLVCQERPWSSDSLAAMNLLALPAGLFLLMRCAPFLHAVPASQILISQLGTISAFLTVYSALCLNRKKETDRSLGWLAATLAGITVAGMGMGQAETHPYTLALAILELCVLSVLLSLSGWLQQSGIPARAITSVRFCTLILLIIAVCGLAGLLPSLIIARATAINFLAEGLVWVMVLIASAYLAGLTRFYFSLTSQKKMVDADTRFPTATLWCVTASVSLLSVVLLFPAPSVSQIWPGPILRIVPLLFEQDWLLCSLSGLSLLVALILAWMASARRDIPLSESEQPALIQLGRSHYYAISLISQTLIQPLLFLSRIASLIEEWIVLRISRFSLEKIPDYWGTLILHMQNGQAAFPTLILVMTLSVLIFVLLVLQI